MPAAKQTAKRPALSDLAAATGTSLATKKLNCKSEEQSIGPSAVAMKR